MHAIVLDGCCSLTPLLGDVLESIGSSGGLAAYALLTLALVLGACGVPVPEEAVFAVGGALAATGRVAWPVVYVLGWSVVLVLDIALHAIGARLGPSLERSRLGRRIGPERWVAIRRLVERRGLWGTVGARFVMGLRIPTFLLAGAMGMPRRRFIAAVALAGLVSAAVPLALGHALAAHLDDLLEALGTARWALLGAALLLLVWWASRRRR